MATQIKNTLAFSLAPGASVVIAHGLNDGGYPKEPDIVFVPTSELQVTVDDINVTLTNLGSATLAGSVLVEWWHTIEREFGDVANLDLSVKPYIVVGSEIPNTPPIPPFPVPLEFRTIYVRSTGNDATGNGLAPATAFRTIVRAVRNIPYDIPPGVRYIVNSDDLGVEVLPDDYAFPPWKGASGQFGAVEFESAMRLDASVPAASATINLVDVLAVTTNPVTGQIAIQLTVAAAAAKGWVAGQFAGVPGVSPGKIFFDSGAVDPCAIVGNTTDTLFIAAIDPGGGPIFPCSITECSTTLEGRSVLSDGGAALSVLNNDGIAFSGIHFRGDDGSSIGIWVFNCFAGFNACQIEGASFQNTNRHALISSCYLSNSVWESRVYIQNTHADIIGGLFGEAADRVYITSSVVDETVVAVEDFNDLPPGNFAIFNSQLLDSPGVGMRLTGGTGVLENVLIDGSVDNAVVVDKGQGYLRLLNVQGTALGDYGLRVNDGGYVEVDALTNVAGQLTGAVDDLSVGDLADAAWPGVAFSRNDYTYDPTAGAPAQVTGTGSRAYQV